ncbi:hypothetical protein PInf_024298 [Phytophthora infestans]|nr:hypothetical protein PInf_024298 [Phytophthora infestans]
MNSLLFLYLNLIRGPQIVAARREKEEKEKRAQLEADIASGKVTKMASCKKCDAPVNRLGVSALDLKALKRGADSRARSESA